jgi:hypothetical protein
MSAPLKEVMTSRLLLQVEAEHPASFILLHKSKQAPQILKKW